MWIIITPFSNDENNKKFKDIFMKSDKYNLVELEPQPTKYFSPSWPVHKDKGEYKKIK